MHETSRRVNVWGCIAYALEQNKIRKAEKKKSGKAMRSMFTLL